MTYASLWSNLLWQTEPHIPLKHTSTLPSWASVPLTSLDWPSVHVLYAVSARENIIINIREKRMDYSSNAITSTGRHNHYYLLWHLSPTSVEHFDTEVKQADPFIVVLHWPSEGVVAEHERLFNTLLVLVLLNLWSSTIVATKVLEIF